MEPPPPSSHHSSSTNPNNVLNDVRSTVGSASSSSISSSGGMVRTAAPMGIPVSSVHHHHGHGGGGVVQNVIHGGNVPTPPQAPPPPQQQQGGGAAHWGGGNAAGFPSNHQVNGARNGMPNSLAPPPPSYQPQPQQQQRPSRSSPLSAQQQQQHRAAARNAAQSSQAWSVPNPLASLGLAPPPQQQQRAASPSTRVTVQHRQHLTQQQQQQQQQMRGIPPPPPSQQIAHAPHQTRYVQQQAQLRAVVANGGSASSLTTNAAAPPQLVVPPPTPIANLQPLHPQPPQRTYTSPPQPPQQQQNTSRRIRLTPEARTALTRAVLSAIHSPTGSIEPQLMKEAMAVGLPQSAILTAAKVAREREVKKKQDKMAAAAATSGGGGGYVQMRHAPPPQQQHLNHHHHHTHAPPQQSPVMTSVTHPSSMPPPSQNRSEFLPPPPPQASAPPSSSPVSRKNQYMPSSNDNNNMPMIPSSAIATAAAVAAAQQQSVATAQTQIRNNVPNNNYGRNMPPPPMNAPPRGGGGWVASSPPPPPPHHQRRPIMAPPPSSSSSYPPTHSTYNVRPTKPPTSNTAMVPSSSSPHHVVKQQQKVSSMYNTQQNIPGKKLKHLQQMQASQSSSSGNTTTTSTQRGRVKKEVEVKISKEEQEKWKRVVHGLLFVRKDDGRSSVGGMVRCGDGHVNVLFLRGLKNMEEEEGDWRKQALALQKQLSITKTPPTKKQKQKHTTQITTNTLQTLLNLSTQKRYKLQPRKEVKLLEKTLKKSRQNTTDTLLRRHKEITKAIFSHQFEFYKFHRLRKAEISRLSRNVRDYMDRKEKKKEKDADMAERARLAALKANDMKAYSALLEETKNERLKFLLDKTGECMDQISTLLQKKVAEDGEGNYVGGTATLEEDGTTNGSYYTSAHVKTEEVRQPSILVGGDLKEYQLAGLQWLVSLYNNKLNGILADEMGLGKTIQTISLLAYLMEMKENLGPYLVIVPLSTMSNWVNEFAKWCPTARVVAYKGNPQQRKELYREEVASGHFNVLLTTYEYVIRDKASLRKIPWQYAIVDEGHRMKNAQSKFAVILGTQYTTKHRILLTGTPLQNNLPELWALLNFLLPTIFNSVETFDQWFNRPFAQFGTAGASSSSAGGGGGGGGESGSEEGSDDMLSNEERMLIIHRLHELLRPFMLRRVKSEVLDQLPEKVEKVLRCELSSWQKALYKQISANATSDKSLINGTSGQAVGGVTRGLNNVVMQLRKVCNHPYLFSPEGYRINDDLIRCSGKMELLDRMLPKLKAAGHRVLMFTQMTAAMTILEDYFAYRGYASLRLDGSTPAEERERRMYKFNAPDSPYFIFLLSTRAGGLGLNLATADTVIIFDSDWNPMMDLQAQDRAHRIGQRNDVRVFRLVTNSPVEEKILSRATEKLNMSELVVEAGKFDKSSVEDDNSQERLKMMEVLLTDFDTTASAAAATVSTQPDGSSSELAEDDTGGPDTEGSSNDGNDDRELLNEMLSSNDADYKLYCNMDEKMNAMADEGIVVCTPGLATDPEDIPDWIRYPEGKKKHEEKAKAAEAGEELPSKRRAVNRTVTYNDGLTERQFVRMMEKEAEAEENAAKKRKRERKLQKESETDVSSTRNGRKRSRNSMSSGTSHPSSDEDNVSDDEIASNEPLSDTETNEPMARKGGDDGEGISDETNRLLIKVCKAVAACKEAGTRRLVSEIFLEKPCEKTYPDYYQIISKPIAINDILGKCRRKQYKEIAGFMDDWELLFSNARTYNAEGSWVVVDAGTLEVELNRLMKKNDLHENTVPKPAKPLRIKLSLKAKKNGDADTSAKRSRKGKKNKKRNKRSRNSTGSSRVIESEEFEADSDDDDDYIEDSISDPESHEASGIVGMDERAAAIKKAKLSGGVSSRNVGRGPGSRGGKGSYNKRK